MKIIRDKINIEELKEMAKKGFGSLIKAVVDIEREMAAIDGEMHVDLEKMLLDDGSEQKNLWGINLYPDIESADWLEFDSMINLRPWQDNRTRGVEQEKIRKKIIEIVNKLVER